MDELEIVLNWKNLVKGTFYLYRYPKNYAIFLNANPASKAYGVLSLTDEFDKILASDLPIVLEAVLLPFKEQIIYDGFLISLPHHFWIW